eukprot:925638-Rhodomonas_salina.1
MSTGCAGLSMPRFVTAEAGVGWQDGHWGHSDCSRRYFREHLFFTALDSRRTMWLAHSGEAACPSGA